MLVLSCPIKDDIKLKCIYLIENLWSLNNISEALVIGDKGGNSSNSSSWNDNLWNGIYLFCKSISFAIGNNLIAVVSFSLFLDNINESHSLFEYLLLEFVSNL